MTSLGDNAAVPKTKKPSDSAFKQQRLPAWQPILTAGTVLPAFFVIGIAFIPVGIGLLTFSRNVNEHTVDYTDCKGINYDNKPCSDVIAAGSVNPSCICKVPVHLDKDFSGNVYMYYGLTNFYQNHRRYVKSRDDNQLLGRLGDDVSTDCGPFLKADNSSLTIAPCGAIANSLFSDTLTLTYSTGATDKQVPLINTGIAWPSDKNIKFRNPEGDLKLAFKDKFAKPKNWSKEIWELDEKNPDNNGFQNEDLIVWMRTAALPTFRKLYRRVGTDSETFLHGLIKRNYTLVVEYNYYVSAFGGNKTMILSTTTLLGGKNPFLGIAYIVVGCVCLVLGVALLIIHIKCSKSTNEMINVNQNTPYQ